MGHLWLWLDSGVKPVPRACFRSSLCLLSSRLVSVLALFVESWQQQLYPQFPSDSYFSHETSEADIVIPLIWLGSDQCLWGNAVCWVAYDLNPKHVAWEEWNFPHSNITEYYRKEAGNGRPKQVHHTQGHWTSSSRLIIWLQLLRREQSSVGFPYLQGLKKHCRQTWYLPALGEGASGSVDQCSRLSMLGPNTGLHFSAWTPSSSL